MGLVDAMGTDGGVSGADVGSVDAMRSDVGSIDATVEDTAAGDASRDAGSTDAGSTDAGSTDVGTDARSGAPDAWPCHDESIPLVRRVRQ